MSTSPSPYAPQITLTALDEYFCHQTVKSFEDVESTDRNWTEKCYIVVFDTSGEVMVTIGLGKYINRNVMDGFCGVALRDRIHNVRASRELRPDLDSLIIGPIQWHIVQPPLKNRIVLTADNDVGISCDLTFESDYWPIVGKPGRRRVNGYTDNHTIRYFQSGRGYGTVTVKGKTYTITKENSYAYKDRSWGVRSMTGIPREGNPIFNEPEAIPENGIMQVAPMPQDYGMLHGYLNLQFEDFALSALYTRGPDGKPLGSPTGSTEGFVVFPHETGKAPLAVVDMDLDYRFWPGTRRVRSCELTAHLEDGSSRKIACANIGLTWWFRAGGYFGFRGWWQGKYMGKLAVGGESMDLSDKAVRDEIYGCEEIAVECSCDGKKGYGVLEPWVFGTLKKYGVEAHHLG
jgi:hypothetical protein